MSVSYRKGKFVVDTNWPDGIRTRFRRPTEEKASELDLEIQLSITRGSWSNVRAAIQMGDKNPGKFASCLFGDIADLYYSDHVQTHNRSAYSKKGFLERFKNSWGRLSFGSMTLQHVDKYIAARKKDGVKNSTINRELSTLRHLYEWGIKRGFVERNPMARMEKLEEQEWAGPKPTDEVIQAVFAKLDPLFLPIYIVMRETGARRDEILSLQHWQIDRENGVVTFAKRTKNGKCTVAPLTQRALEAIDSIPVLPGCPYIFYNPKTGTRWFDARKPWVDARNEAKYPWLRVRDLRPAFGIEASEKGIPMHFIQSVLGHSSVTVTERYYAKFAPDSAAKALREMIEAGRKASLAQSVAQKGENETAA
jgi:integrase/recombinase XerD